MNFFEVVMFSLGLAFTVVFCFVVIGGFVREKLRLWHEKWQTKRKQKLVNGVSIVTLEELKMIYDILNCQKQVEVKLRSNRVRHGRDFVAGDIISIAATTDHYRHLTDDTIAADAMGTVFIVPQDKSKPGRRYPYPCDKLTIGGWRNDTHTKRQTVVAHCFFPNEKRVLRIDGKDNRHRVDNFKTMKGETLNIDPCFFKVVEATKDYMIIERAEWTH